MSQLESDSIKMELIRYQNDDLSYSEMARRTGISRTAITNFLNKETYKEWWELHDKPIASGTYYDHHTSIKQLNKKRYIVTSAQNNTFVHEPFLRSLETMAERIDAQIIVGTFSYNLNGFQNLSKSEGDWFDPKIEQYILDEPALLAPDLIWCGELNILPTAVNPLSGFHSYTKGRSGIIPHVKVQLESLPRHKTEDPRFLYTTGAVTQRNYIQKKAGQKASFHHIFGALVVEVDDDGDWFVRQLIADSDDGCFYDLDTYYMPDDYQDGLPCEAINWGDIHSEKIDHDVANGSFVGEDSLLDYMRPEYQFVHDLLDFSSRNHHNRNDPYFRFKEYLHGADSVYLNVSDTVDVLEDMDRDWCQTIVVESNHDLALKRWLKEADYKNDPANAITFLKYQLAMYEAIGRGEFDFSIFEYAVKDQWKECGAKFLKTDESFKICGDDGIECGNHGHLGNNGTRGSVLSHTKLGTRYNIGHTHSASIRDGVYCAGTMSKLDMGYNQGGTTWSHSHVITYLNGKRTIVTMRANKFKASN